MRPAYGYGRDETFVGAVAAFGFGTQLIGVLLDGFRIVLSRSTASMALVRSSSSLALGRSAASMAMALSTASIAVVRTLNMASIVLGNVAKGAITTIRHAAGLAVAQSEVGTSTRSLNTSTVVTTQSTASLDLTNSAASIDLIQEEF